jgi:hypothetical protein
MKTYKIKVPIKWVYISDNPYRINPLIRALTVMFFGTDTLQIPLYCNFPIPDRDNVRKYTLHSISPKKKTNDVEVIDLGESISERLSNWKVHGYLKPCVFEISVTETFVQNIRDWQRYWRIEPDLGFTEEMKQQPNENEHYKYTKAVNHGNNSGDSKRDKTSEGDYGRGRAFATISNRKTGNDKSIPVKRAAKTFGRRIKD